MSNSIKLLKLSASEQEQLLKQVEAEYNLAKELYRQDLKVWDEWLDFYIKQRMSVKEGIQRNDVKGDAHKDLLIDNLVYTIHQTILAALYENKITIDFMPMSDGDYTKVSLLTKVAEYDHDAMELDRMQFDWLWDATFFGRTVVSMKDFDRKNLMPDPELFDPLTFLRDPKAQSINGDRKGRGQARFFGRFFISTLHKLMQDKGIQGWRDNNEIHIRKVSDYKDLDETYKLMYKNLVAKGVSPNKALYTTDLGYNQEYLLIEWFTHWDGKKIGLITTPEFDRIFKVYTMDAPNDNWLFIDRVFQPIPHKWGGVPVPTTTVDKQLVRTVTFNILLDILSLVAQRPTFVDTTRIVDKSQLYTPETGRIVEVVGPTQGISTTVDLPGVDWGLIGSILNYSDELAQKSLATPEIMQGVLSRKKRPATEIEAMMTNVNTRYKLYVKTIEWSEKRFWQTWYYLYKNNFTASDKKFVRIGGALSKETLTISRDDIMPMKDPDVVIQSSVTKQLENQAKLASIVNLVLPLAGQTEDLNKRYIIKKMLEYAGFGASEIEYIVPPTPDELKARSENIALEQNRKVDVDANDDHIAHILEHNKGAQTKEMLAHVGEHLEAIRVAGQQVPMLPQATPGQGTQGGQAEARAIEALMGGGNQMVPEEQTPPMPEEQMQEPGEGDIIDEVNQDINSLLGNE